MVKAFIMQVLNLFGTKAELEHRGHHAQRFPSFLPHSKGKIYILAKYSQIMGLTAGEVAAIGAQADGA
jgi:hypothetical protein